MRAIHSSFCFSAADKSRTWRLCEIKGLNELRNPEVAWADGNECMIGDDMCGWTMLEGEDDGPIPLGSTLGGGGGGGGCDCGVGERGE